MLHIEILVQLIDPDYPGALLKLFPYLVFNLAYVAVIRLPDRTAENIKGIMRPGQLFKIMIIKRIGKGIRPPSFRSFKNTGLLSCNMPGIIPGPCLTRRLDLVV